jgi:hypothetical protein
MHIFLDDTLLKILLKMRTARLDTEYGKTKVIEILHQKFISLFREFHEYSANLIFTFVFMLYFTKERIFTSALQITQKDINHINKKVSSLPPTSCKNQCTAHI